MPMAYIVAGAGCPNAMAGEVTASRPYDKFGLTRARLLETFLGLELPFIFWGVAFARSFAPRVPSRVTPFAAELKAI